MSKRKQREMGRLTALLEQISIGEAFCKKHQRYITTEDLAYKKCYTGSHGQKWCKYYERR